MYARSCSERNPQGSNSFRIIENPSPLGTFGWVTGGFIGVAPSPAIFGNEFIKPMDVFFVYLAGRVCP